MSITPEMYIGDARRFQQFGDYDLAIESLREAMRVDTQKKYAVEIQKLLCFNYRKIGNYDMALLYINNAINSLRLKNQPLSTISMLKEYAVCLMNKGIVFEEKGESVKALNCYLEALDIFLDLYKDDENNYGIIINALFTIGALYYKEKHYSKSKEYFEKAMSFFENDVNKEQDRRYITIINTLKEIEDC